VGSKQLVGLVFSDIVDFYCGTLLVFFEILQFLSLVDKNVRVLVQILCHGFVWLDFLFVSVEVPHLLLCIGGNAMLLLFLFIFLSQRSSMGCITKTHTSG
jgi:hypothetical protein